MIPEIRFESEQNGVAWKADDGHVGLEFVDRVRRELDEPELPLNKIDDFVRHDWARYVSVELTEERARGLVGRYGYFCVVAVPRRSLDRYVVIGYKVERNDYSGEIERVVPRWTVDTQRLFADWEAAGCPLVWTPPGHEQEQEEESS